MNFTDFVPYIPVTLILLVDFVLVAYLNAKTKEH